MCVDVPRRCARSGCFPARAAAAADWVRCAASGSGQRDMLVLAWGLVRAAAGAELELAGLEMLLELSPLHLGRRAVLLGRADRAALREERPVGADQVVLEHRRRRPGWCLARRCRAAAR